MEESDHTSDEYENSRDAGAGAEGLPVFSPEKFRSELRFSLTLVAIFWIVYFSSAMLASAPLKDVAAVLILSIPLVLWVGWFSIATGVVVVGIYLKNVQTQTGRGG